jgi:hypothetical protein
MLAHVSFACLRPPLACPEIWWAGKCLGVMNMTSKCSKTTQAALEIRSWESRPSTSSIHRLPYFVILLDLPSYQLISRKTRRIRDPSAMSWRAGGRVSIRRHGLDMLCPETWVTPRGQVLEKLQAHLPESLGCRIRRLIVPKMMCLSIDRQRRTTSDRPPLSHYPVPPRPFSRALAYLLA